MTTNPDHPGDAAASCAAPAAAPLPLLLVDDDPLLRGMAERTLRHAGFAVVACPSGEAALAAFAAERFALVLLDVLMPGLDGYETCRRLRALPNGAAVPIIVLTGLNDTAAIAEAYQAGATDFIAKPIHWTLLAQRVRYALRAAATAAEATLNRGRLERAQRIARMGNWEVDAAGRHLLVSPALAELFAAPPGAAERVSLASFIERVHPEDQPRVRAARDAALRDGRPYKLNFRVVRFDGEVRTVFEQAEPRRDEAGRLTHIEGVTQDITERVEAERRIAFLAHFDAVTRLPNRQFFIEMATPALERAARLSTTCALLHIDIDRFKSVNDAVGRAEGDRVLVQLAERLQASVRVADLASVGAGERTGTDATLARVGANAFTLLLVEVGGEHQAAQVARRLMEAIALPLAAQGRELALSASVGIALYPRDAADARALARAAEQAAYAAKEAGRSQLRFFDEAIHRAASMRLQHEAELRRGIAEGQLRLHYQPKVDAASGRIVGAEALVRWQHPERGLLGPLEFIPLAEDTGLVLPLTDWVLEEAARHQRARIDAGLAAVPVSVNLASPCFMREDLPAQLDALLARHRLQPASLMLEVTESLLMADVPQAVQRLTELRARGFKLSLDDFGTGFSSLNYLSRFPVDELKIDRSFVCTLGDGPREGAIARSIIALGSEFGLEVVAEGVETEQQADILVRHGCRSQQGYLFARPMAVEAFDELLRRGRVVAEAGAAVQAATVG